MSSASRLFLAAVLPLALAAPAASWAAPVAPPVSPVGQAALMRPLTLVRIADMDFGNLGVTANGTNSGMPARFPGTVGGSKPALPR